MYTSSITISCCPIVDILWSTLYINKECEQTQMIHFSLVELQRAIWRTPLQYFSKSTEGMGGETCSRLNCFLKLKNSFAIHFSFCLHKKTYASRIPSTLKYLYTFFAVWSRTRACILIDLYLIREKKLLRTSLKILSFTLHILSH